MNDAVEHELERLRPIWEEGGNLSAVVDALTWCRKFSLAPPPWLYEALGVVLSLYAEGEPSGKRWHRRWIQDMKDLDRHDVVEDAIGRHPQWKEELKAFEAESGAGARRVARELRRNLEITRHGKHETGTVFQTAAEMLAKVGDHCGAHAVRTSWKKVKRITKSEPHRYYCGRMAMRRNPPGLRK